MFCQQSFPIGAKLLFLKKTFPVVVLKLNVYNDSIRKPIYPKRQKLEPIDKSFEKPYTITSNILDAQPKNKRDWFEDFRRTEFTPEGINNWWHMQKKDMEMITQEFIEERHKILGSDLAAATFIINLGGKAKFKGHDEWITLDEKGNVPLPKNFDPNYILIALDISGINLHYEGLHNLINLTKLEWVSFKGNKYLNDWSLDKISAQFINLEYLDISECEQVSERGLESLYRMQKLKKLIVTNYSGTTTLELICLMLEECIPTLKFEILSPPSKPQVISENKKSKLIDTIKSIIQKI